MRWVTCMYVVAHACMCAGKSPRMAETVTHMTPEAMMCRLDATGLQEMPSWVPDVAPLASVEAVKALRDSIALRADDTHGFKASALERLALIDGVHATYAEIHRMVPTCEEGFRVRRTRLAAALSPDMMKMEADRLYLTQLLGRYLREQPYCLLWMKEAKDAHDLLYVASYWHGCASSSSSS